MILHDKYAKYLTEYGWLIMCIPCSQEKERNGVIIKIRRPFSECNWNNHCLCDQNLNELANLISEEETRGKKNQNIKSQGGLTTFLRK